MVLSAWPSTPSYAGVIRTTSPLALRRFVQVGLTITVVLASFSTELAVAGHRWRISPFRSREGIPYQRVRDLLETPDGAIWIATWGGGAARVKDTEWEHFDEDNGLLNNWVRCLEVDGEGAIWIGTSRGVCVYRDGRFEEVTSNPPLPSVGIRALKLTRNGQMWVALQIENGNEYQHEASFGSEYRRESSFVILISCKKVSIPFTRFSSLEFVSYSSPFRAVK